MQEKFEQLQKAKDNVRWLLDNPDGSVDFKGIEYWASEIERLRKDIKENL